MSAPDLRRCGHPLGDTRWCPDCELAEARREQERAVSEDQIAALVVQFKAHAAWCQTYRKRVDHGEMTKEAYETARQKRVQAFENCLRGVTCPASTSARPAERATPSQSRFTSSNEDESAEPVGIAASLSTSTA